ncbi:hypothetical protein MPNT_20130 [Candidatus Methylacidithermus pantelleriae]|uniref:Uncharacterized protein n=1 Tax=Candidatus Methylacidithermus pantelleriae TaxID=2744239 RepID=A0A8J2BPD9_9BACT|nr:hypothetical protein MPNT_20130 [Candidatus Methylacidithermus pantelleriae]
MWVVLAPDCDKGRSPIPGVEFVARFDGWVSGSRPLVVPGILLGWSCKGQPERSLGSTRVNPPSGNRL